jgi:Domain of unknown function (DUF4157)
MGGETAPLANAVTAEPSRAPTATLQRTCECGRHLAGGGECDECRRRKSAVAPPIVHHVLRSPGRPLDAGTRARFEPRFAHDFSAVRIHADSSAAESARAVAAKAYTVGSHVVFGEGRYAPHTAPGQTLLAHELVHVVQQAHATAPHTGLTVAPADGPLEREAAAASRGARTRPAPAAAATVQRDLATEPPVVAPPAQPDLTDAQIKEAIAFNEDHYDGANTRLIQRLLGGPVTGVWTEENIEAVAATQEEYGLQKDGKVGHETFVFLNREQQLERMSTSTRNCLVSFHVQGPEPARLERLGPDRCSLRGFFGIRAEFSRRCGCGHFEYRQFIRGHFRRTRGTATIDMGDWFARLPAGRITDDFQEDGDIDDVPENYGHRDDPAGADPLDHYVDAAGNEDQAGGCRYASVDRVGSWGGGDAVEDCRPGDVYDVEVAFRGEIQRDGVPIQQKLWTAIRRARWTP